MIKFWSITTCFLCLFTLKTLSLSNPPLNTFVALNECFQYKKGFKIDLHEAHMVSADSIQFKDDCLKACLKNMIDSDFVCKSLMHMPADDECVLTAMNTDDGAKLEKIELDFIFSINYYENKCAGSPFGQPAAIAQAKFESFKGIMGAVQIAKIPGKDPMMLAVIDGLRPNSMIDISIRKSPVQDCFKLRHYEIKLSDRLLQVFTDSTGFAVQPWVTVDKNVLGSDYLGSSIVLIDTLTQRVLECQVIGISGDQANYDQKKNGAVGLSLPVVPLFVLFALFFTF